MHLPWRKTSRISRIVADLPSPRHGGSLVVQTGFPASLIDLFFKNRDRLLKKKPSSKKRRKTQPTQLHISDPIIPPPPSPLSDLLYPSCSTALLPAFAEDLISERLEETVRAGDHGGQPNSLGVEQCVDGCAESSRVFVAVLKLFVVVAFALSTRKLAVGITLSAFLLLLLECVGKYAVRFLKPCSNAKLAMESLVLRVSGFLRIRESNLVLKKVETGEEESGSMALIIGEDDVVKELIEGTKLNSLIEEIQLAEPDFNSNDDVEGIDLMESKFDISSRDSRWGCFDGEKTLRDGEENGEAGEISLCRNQSSRRAKLKAKIIKKLVPKKLRNAKKQKKKNNMEELESISEAYSFFGNEKLLGEETVLQEGEIQSRVCKEHAEEVTCFSECTKTGEEVAVTGEDERSKKAENSLCIFLVMAILAGLIGGRFVALVLAVAGCYMFKLIGACRRYLNQPISGLSLS